MWAIVSGPRAFKDILKLSTALENTMQIFATQIAKRCNVAFRVGLRRRGNP